MLHRILLIAKRDYIASVLSKAFLIGLIFAPLMFGSAFFGIAIMRSTDGNTIRHIAIVDHTEVLAPVMIAAMASRDPNSIAAQAAKQNEQHYEFELAAPAAPAAENDQQRLELSDRVRRGELFSFVEIGESVFDETSAEANPLANLTSGRPVSASEVAVAAGALLAGPSNAPVTIYSAGSGIDDSRALMAEAINTAVRNIRLGSLGVSPDQARAALRPVAVARKGLLARDASGAIAQPKPRNELEGFAVPFALMFLMVMVVMGSAAPMLGVIAEDKAQRVFEMLLASVTPFELMAGKVLASLGRSLTSSVVYVIGAVLGLQGAAMIGLVPFHLLPWFFAYMIAEVAMLSALGAALGAACSQPRDAQSLAIFLVLPTILPAMLVVPLVQQPNGTMATVLSFVPFLTPMVMLLRQAMPSGVPAWQPWVGLAGTVIASIAIVWAAARIFRVTILMQGKPPRFADLIRYAIQG